jgi:hypothetical protein
VLLGLAVSPIHRTFLPIPPLLLGPLTLALLWRKFTRLVSCISFNHTVIWISILTYTARHSDFVGGGEGAGKRIVDDSYVLVW